MIRTQIYLPEDTHTDLTRLAHREGVTISQLIRRGADQIIKHHKSKLSAQEKALRFFANPPKKYLVKLSKPAHILVRENRD